MSLFPELIILLLPVAAMSGWWAAMRMVKKNQANCKSPDPNYIKGLNYVLNEQPDKAIDLFIKMLEVDNDTAEAHLALGGLFRRRGETERAIRIHQNLISRENLSREQRAQGLLELAQDYLKAGLFDRAENLFKELLEFKALHEHALYGLSKIYQQEREWQKTLYVTKQLSQLTGESLNIEKSHYLCEMAEEALAETEITTEQQSKIAEWLDEAQSLDPLVVRPLLIKARIALQKEDYPQALDHLEQVESRDGDYFSEILTHLILCYQELGTEKQLADYLQLILDSQPSTPVLLAYIDILKKEGLAQASVKTTEYLKEHPNLTVIKTLCDLQLEQNEGLTKAQLEVLQVHFSKQLKIQAKYQCRQCGYESKLLHWQCPSCRQWSSTKPV